MKTRLDTLLVSSLLALTVQLANAEQAPLNINPQVPTWAAGQVPITWGDCIPVPVVPMPDNMMIPSFAPTSYPVQGAMPMMMPNNPPLLLPPPSPFFNAPKAPAPIAPTIAENCDNSAELKLKELQLRYEQGASASKKNIEELKQALEDAQNQMNDGLGIIEELSRKQKTAESMLSDLEAQLKDLNGNNDEANDKATDLEKQIAELNDANKSLKAKLSTAENDSSAQARKLTAIGNTGAVLSALQSTYKERNDEVVELKKELAKLGKFQSSSALKSAQDNNTIESLKKKLTDLDNENKTLKSKLSTVEMKTGEQSRKLTALGQSATELMAVKSAYKERNDETVELKKKLTDLDNENKTLKSKLSSFEMKTGEQSRKLTALGQSATELTAIKSAYKERNDENVELKKQLAELEKSKSGLNARLDSLQTQNTIQVAQDNNIIDELKKKLATLDGNNKSLISKLSTAESSAGSQARKLTALGQSATELTALQSAYKDRNEEVRVLKSKLEQLKNSLDIANSCETKAKALKNNLAMEIDKEKSLLAKISKLENAAAAQARKITALTTTTSELTALKSAYKDLSSKKLALSSQLTEATADTDKDGVLDKNDDCPFSLAGMEVNAKGCIADADSDGVVDSKDKCPTSPAGSQVNAEGCPNIKDADGDNVADASDLCPNTAAGSTVNEFGCMPTENITLEGVNFNTGSARLTTSSLPILSAAADTLQKSPKLNIEIAGYTDNQGSSRINRKLSQNRANAVMIQLIKDGIGAGRLTAKGYGEKNPVATNKTEKGRATNRRVELKIRK